MDETNRLQPRVFTNCINYLLVISTNELFASSYSWIFSSGIIGSNYLSYTVSKWRVNPAIMQSSFHTHFSNLQCSLGSIFDNGKYGKLIPSIFRAWIVPYKCWKYFHFLNDSMVFYFVFELWKIVFVICDVFTCFR